MDSPEEPVLAAGSVFAGRYRIMRLLGEGDRKRTYLAEDAVVPRKVAVALIKPRSAHADPVGTRREADALAQAGSHDNVVTLHDWGIIEGTEYLVFDYLSGGTLREYLVKRTERGKPLSAEDVMRLGRQLARALAHVHKLGFIHRDLAPANVWLDERQVAHLGDFDSAVGRDEALAPAALPPTTEAYAAPEQLTGSPFDERSDLYSLGAVLFEALTGERPTRVPMTALAARLSTLRPDIPRKLNQTICRMLAEPPDERPASAEEVLEALKSARVHRSPDEGLLSWMDALPFPLASILWHYDGEPDAGAKVACLLKFFEALAQFTGTALMSGCTSDGALLEANHTAWFGGDGHEPVGLHRATFGTWVELSVRLAGTVREMLDSEVTTARCRELFAAADDDLLGALTSREFIKILRHALGRRNTWSGHDGLAGERTHRERLGDLQDLLVRTQALLGWSFETWTLLRPGPMTRSRGVFDLTAAILKGPNPVFRRAQIQLTESLDTSRLYLLNNGQTRALELMPFIRVLPATSGQEACYFYSRLEGTSVRWVSYHFQDEPELVLPDDELADLLARLAPRDSGDGKATGTKSTSDPEPGGIPKRGSPPPKDAPGLYEYCQRCGYPFGRLTAQELCRVRAACDRRLRDPGYRVPSGREQNLAIRAATIAAHPELGSQ